jgi:hypothetical protein
MISSRELSRSVAEELSSPAFAEPWKAYQRRECFKSLAIREKLGASSPSDFSTVNISPSSGKVKVALGEEDLRSTELNTSGWPQSRIRSKASVQQELWEETQATTPTVESLLTTFS